MLYLFGSDYSIPRCAAGIFSGSNNQPGAPVRRLPRCRSLTISSHVDPGGQVVFLAGSSRRVGVSVNPRRNEVAGRQHICSSHGRPWHAGVPVGREFRCLACFLANALAVKVTMSNADNNQHDGLQVTR